MKQKITAMLPFYAVILSLFLAAAHSGSKAVTALSESFMPPSRSLVIIDAGHGGEDGGAVSCTGISESKLNLEIALRLEDMMHLLGIDTYMIRRTDCSVHTNGNTISSRKISDLKERVRIINESSPALTLSIHQNYFPDSKYSGPQVFFRNSEASKALASEMQSSLTRCLCTSNNRKEKPADGIFLMENIDCTAILIECGFLSNPQEEAKLRQADYQKELCAVIAAATAQFLSLDAQTND